MLLVLGGTASGKKTFVYSLGYSDTDFCASPLDPGTVCIELDKALREGPLTSAAREALAAKDVVTCTEVGQGVVPIDAGERAWRELVGRTCAQLAAEADCVVRMVCGIPLVLKGTLPNSMK